MFCPWWNNWVIPWGHPNEHIWQDRYRLGHLTDLIRMVPMVLTQPVCTEDILKRIEDILKKIEDILKGIEVYI